MNVWNDRGIGERQLNDRTTGRTAQVRLAADTFEAFADWLDALEQFCVHLRYGSPAGFAVWCGWLRRDRERALQRLRCWELVSRCTR